MASLTVTIKPRSTRPQKFLVELDAEKLEKLAANFGLFNPEFLKSLERAEKDYQTGRVRKIKSFKELRK